MKQSFFFSLSIHVGVCAVMLLGILRAPKWRETPQVYSVELVSASQLSPRQAVSVSAAPKKKPAEKKAINVPEAKPKKKQPEQKPARQPEPKPAEAGGARMTVNAKDFPFSYYLSLLYSRLRENWQPPFQMDKQSRPLRATLAFRISREGRVSEAGVEKSSQSFIFDQAALRAVLSVNPLPPLPNEFGGDHLKVHIEFEGIKE